MDEISLFSELKELGPKSIVITFLLLSSRAFLSPKDWALIKIPKVIDVFSSPAFSGIGKSSSIFEMNWMKYPLPESPL